MKASVRSATASALRPGVWNTGTPWRVAAARSTFTGSPRQQPTMRSAQASNTSACTMSASTTSTSAPTSRMCRANDAPSKWMWWRSFQSSWTTDIDRSRRRSAAGSKDAVTSARMTSAGHPREQRVRQVGHVPPHGVAKRRVGEAAAEDRAVRPAVEEIDHEDRVHRQHEEARGAVVQPRALRPRREVAPGGREHVLLEALVEGLGLDDAPHEEPRHVRLRGEEVEQLAHHAVHQIAAPVGAGRHQRRHGGVETVRDPREYVAEHREVERLLRGPVVVEARDVHPGPRGDLPRRGALEAALREDGFRRLEDPVLGGPGGLAAGVDG